MKNRIRPAFLAALFAAVTFTANANETTPFKYPPILGGDEAMRAARQALDERNYRVLEKIVKEEPDVSNRLFTSGFSLLSYAANYGDVKATRILLDNGADPNSGTGLSGGWTPLTAALYGLRNYDYGKSIEKTLRRDFIEVLSILFKFNADYLIDGEGNRWQVGSKGYSFIPHMMTIICSTKEGTGRVQEFSITDLNPFKDHGVKFHTHDFPTAFQANSINALAHAGLHNPNCTEFILQQIEVTDPVISRTIESLFNNNQNK